jgi:hypothetical protein
VEGSNLHSEKREALLTTIHPFGVTSVDALAWLRMRLLEECASARYDGHIRGGMLHSGLFARKSLNSPMPDSDTVIAKTARGFAIDIGGSHRAFRGFLSRKTTPRCLLSRRSDCEGLSRVLPGAACGRASQTADRRHAGIGNYGVPR